MNWLIFLAFFRNLLFKMGNSSGKKSLLTKNKRGWLLIMEAFISIMFLLGFSIYMIQKQTPKVDISEEIQKQARYIIKAAAHDNDVRNAVIGRNNCSVKNFVYQQLKQYAPYLDYHVKLCDPGMSCRITYGEKQDYKAKGIDLEKKEIYADDYLFSANLTVFRPTVLKVFLWMSEQGPSAPGTSILYYPCETTIPQYDCNADTVSDCIKTDNTFSCKGICMNGTKFTCDDGGSFVSEQPTTPKDENNYEFCKYNNIDDEDCDGLISCFGGVPKDLTRRDSDCYGNPVAKNTDPTSIYGTCNVAECLCLLTEGPAGSPACKDGFDNDGNGVWDDADPGCQ